MDPEVKVVHQTQNDAEPSFSKVSIGARAPGKSLECIDFVIQPPWNLGVSCYTGYVSGDETPWRLVTFEMNLLEHNVLLWIRDTQNGQCIGRYRVEGVRRDDGELTAQVVQERGRQRYGAV